MTTAWVPQGSGRRCRRLGAVETGFGSSCAARSDRAGNKRAQQRQLSLDGQAPVESETLDFIRRFGQAALNTGDWKQETQPYKNRAGTTNIDRGYARVTVQSGSAVFAFASVVDNTTNDPTTVVEQQ